MITKPYTERTIRSDPRARAGANAERQMAHYLHRQLKDDAEVHVLHDLRLEEREQPEHNGSPGVCQIDHLVIHRWGMFIVECKSVTSEVRVRPDGSGGDEWTRVWDGKERGMPSPIRQASRQAQLLRAFLNGHRGELLGRMPLGLRGISKIVNGTDQRGFGFAPIQLVIAVSDAGRIQRLNGWTEPHKPFRVFVSKADLVPEKINQEIKRHRKSASLLNLNPTTDYGVWRMEREEAAHVAEYLASRHVEPTSTRQDETPGGEQREHQPAARANDADAAGTEPACKYCGSQDLTARSGRYGYYWRCGACTKNTPMPADCTSCGAQGQRGKGVRIRKDRSRYFRDCEHCGTSELVWNEHGA